MGEANEDQGLHEKGCIQAGSIGQLQGMMAFFQAAEERRETREERMVEAVEKVAAQGEAIKVLQDSSNKHDKALAEAFQRLRKVENPSLIIKLSRSKLGRFALAMMVIASLIGFVKNPEALGKFLKAVIQ